MFGAPKNRDERALMGVPIGNLGIEHRVQVEKVDEALRGTSNKSVAG